MHPIQFTDGTTHFELAYTGSYSLSLVTLSVVIAIVASFASISHVDLMRATQSASGRFRWHLTGAVAMGVGVWTMHFVGMVAFRLPLEVHYNPEMTLLSVLPAIAATTPTPSSPAMR
ncbi:MAG: MHYT domain-containing protein, partial [Natronospirillum sp.]